MIGTKVPGGGGGNAGLTKGGGNGGPVGICGNDSTNIFTLLQANKQINNCNRNRIVLYEL